jgi:quinol monooxygenase YgiN
MIGAIFVMKIIPGHKEHLIEALIKHGQAARATEPGCVRFDIFPDQKEENWIWFSEGYVDEEAIETHINGPSHIEQWANFGQGHCMEEWPLTMMTGKQEAIWSSVDGQ